MKSAYQKITARIRKTGFFRTFFYLFGTCFLEKIGIRISVYFFYPRCENAHSETPLSSQNSDLIFFVLKDIDAFTKRDFELLSEYEPDVSHEQVFQKWLASGMECTIGRTESGDCACICWVDSGKNRFFGDLDGFVIQRCNTLPACRGRGYYPATLDWIASYLHKNSPEKPISISCSVFNDASAKGILKAGFQRLGYQFTIHWRIIRKTFYWKTGKP